MVRARLGLPRERKKTKTVRDPGNEEPTSNSRAYETMTLVAESRADSSGASEERLYGLVYDELRALAQRIMRSEGSGHTLQPTALVHEALLKLLDGAVLPSRDRAHLFAIAVRAMRRVLVNHAEAKGALKRGGNQQRQPLDSAIMDAAHSAIDLAALDEALENLRQIKERVVTVVEFRFFGGMTVPEIAAALELSERTVADDWAFARAWLARELSRED
jgi:RNA polymerase sigma factor (TIGR02999 family)